MFRKILGIAVVLSVVFAVLPAFSVRAYAEVSDKDFFSYLTEHANEFEESIDISAFAKRGRWKLDDVTEKIQQYYMQTPELFFVNNQKITLMHNEENYLYKINFDYLYTKKKAQKMTQQLKKAAAEAVRGITEEMSDAEKALAVHDYIILNNAYDHSLKKYTAYHCLVEHSSTCQGYTLAYIYVMRNLLGMECSAVTSDAQNHSWNYLKIGKSWYHVDLTADDLSFTAYGGEEYDGFGEVYHNNLLLSDTACEQSSDLHEKWQTYGLPKANSSQYDSFFWKGSQSAMIPYGGLWYYVVTDENSPGIRYKKGKEHDIASLIRTYSFETGESETVQEVSSAWYLYRDAQTGEKFTRKSWYKRSFVKLALCGNSLYFNTADQVFRFNLKTGKTERVYTLKKANMSIYAISAVSDKKLRVCYKRDLSYTDRYLNLRLS